VPGEPGSITLICQHAKRGSDLVRGYCKTIEEQMANLI
jgi:hypothetical protein